MKKYTLLLSLLLVSFLTQAQLRGALGQRSTAVGAATELNYAEPKEYEIAEIITTGSKFYDGNSMISLSMNSCSKLHPLNIGVRPMKSWFPLTQTIGASGEARNL